MSMSGKQKATRPFSLRTHQRTLWMIFSLMAFVSLAPLGFLTYNAFAASGDLTVQVYNDTDRNGIRGGGDTPLLGATVTVYNRANIAVALNTTSAVNNGVVSFSGLNVGEGYRLEVTNTGANNVISVPGPNNVGFVSFFTASATGNTFGVGVRTLSGTPLGDPGAPNANRYTLVSRVWDDLDGDGVQDAGEPGIPGLTVKIVDGSGITQATAANLGDGRYLFLDSAPSDAGYLLQIDAVPAGYRLSYTGAQTALPSDNLRDSNGFFGAGNVVQAVLPSFTLPSKGRNVEDRDIGFSRGSVQGFVWRDLNGNGIRDTNEPKINGVTVQLFRNGVFDRSVPTANEPGVPIDDAAGYYEFTGLDVSGHPTYTGGPTYSIVIPASEFNPGGLLFGSASPANVASGPGVEGDRGLVNGTDATRAIVAAGSNVSTPVDLSTIPAGQSRPQSTDITAYLGFFRGSVTGSVFFDLDRDGVRDLIPVEEPPIEGVVMCIDSNDDDRCLGETQFSTTQTNGSYRFEDLPFGVTVKVAISEVNFTPSGRLKGLGVSTPPVTGVAVGAFNPGFAYRDLNGLGIATPAITDFDFGILRAEIGNFVFDDANGNGLFDVGDAGLPGVVVTLYDTVNGVADGNDTVVLSTTTGPTGIYTLSNLLSNRDYYAGFRLSAAQQAAGYLLSTIQPAGYPGVNPTGLADLNDIQFNPTAVPGLFRTGIFTITAGTQNPGVDAAAYRPIQVTGKVFFDTDDDDQDPDGVEPGMANIAVRLTSLGADNTIGTGDDRVYDTTTISATNATNGSYAFTSTLGIPPGSVLITVTNPLAASLQFVDPDVGADTTDSDVNASGTLTTSVTLASGTSADFDAGLTGRASLSGRSFLDDNGDGLSSGDADLAGVTVTLDFLLNYPAYNLFGVSVVRPAETTATYTFLNLPDGVFDLSFAAPDATYFPTIDDIGTQPSVLDSDGATTGVDRLLDQPFAGNTGQTRDKGFVQLIDISGRAFYDENANNVDDAESGLAGLVVTLYRPGADGVVNFGGDDAIFTATTSITGFYEFIDQPPGNYGVAFENPASAGFDFVTANQGGNDTIDSDVTNLPLGQTDVLSGTSSVDESDVDAGYIGNAEVSGYTFEDVDGNGLQGGADTNLSGVTVTLTLDPAFAGLNLTFPTQTTGPTGIYSFTNLPAGIFDLTFDDPTTAAYQPTFADVGPQPSLLDSDGVLTGTDQLADQTLAPAAIEDRDQGYVVPIDISGRAFYDLNNDDTDELTPEPGLAGLSVTLLRPGADSSFNTTDDVSSTLTTDATGAYTFSNQVPGDFIVQFENPATAGFDFVTPNVGGDATLDSDVTNLPLGQTSVLTTTSGADVADVDAGYIGNAEVNGNTFIDGTRDGISGTVGDGPLAVVNVALTFTPSYAGLTLPAFPAKTSDATGIYSFTNLPAGTFSLTFTPPVAVPAYQVTVADVITPTSLIDSDGTGTGADQLTSQSLAAQGIEERDQGYVVPITVSGRAFYDLARPTANLDEAGETEPGLAGLTVSLIQPGPNGVFDLAPLSDDVVTTTVTVVTTGAYSFTSVTPGPFIVAFENDPADGFDFVLANQGDDKLDSDVTNPQTGGGATSIITATSGTDISDVDAGYIGNSAVGGYTFNDGTADGLSDTTGDTALAGVTVALTFTPSFPGGLTLGTIPTQLSDATGIYSFTNLPAGTFSLTFTPPLPPPAYQVTLADAGTQPATNDSDGANPTDGLTSQTLAANTDAERDQGYLVRVTISGRAFYDLNNDATDEATPEPGLAGLTVTLYRPGANGVIDFGGDDTTAASTTDATGFYSFSNQLPGLYAVQFANPATAGFDFVAADQGGDEALDSDVTDRVNGRTATATASSGVDVDDVDAGYIGNAAVGGYTFNDGTADGLSNTAGDGPLAGVTVALTFTPSFAGLNLGTIPTQLSNATGIYSFTNLPAGTFSLTFTPPDATYILTTPDVGADDTIDSDSNLANQPLAPNADAERDQGYFVSINISGRVFFDENSNNIDDSEVGLAGLNVTLYLAGNDGNVNFGGDDVISTTLTDATGAYTFTNQPPQQFAVEVENPAGANFIFVAPNIGGDDTVDSDITDTVNGRTGPIDPVSGVDQADIDAGLTGQATVSGYTFVDGEYDGQSGGANDSNLDGVTVFISLNPDFAGLPNINSSQVTAAGGLYSFTNLPAGTFTLSFEPPVAIPDYQTTLADTGPIATDSDGLDAGPDQLTIQPLGATATEQRDQGFYQDVTITVRVFDELVDVDNTFQAAEAGLANITIRLDSLTTSDSFFGASDATGVVTFSVAPGSYQLRIPTDPVTYIRSPGNSGIITVGPLLSGQSSLTDNAGKNSFGYYKNSTVSGSVWFDADGDGLLDLSEPGMEGITVTLVLDTDGVAGGDLDLEVATSDLAGLFNFTTSVTPTAIVGPNARYRLRFSERAGFVFTTLGSPITDDNESDAGVGGLTDAFTVGSNGALGFIDAGYVGTLSVGDLVWEDANANGLQDSGEQSLPDAVVTVSVTTTGGLINSTNPTFVISTTSTASVGLAANYSFDSLPPGSGVSATSVTLFGYALSPSDQGGNDALDSDPVPSLAPTLAPTDTLDFGLYETASIGDRVWLDVNGNQLYDVGADVGFPGVVVQLLDANGAVIAQTTSATNGDIGFYQFTNIIPGTYAVQFNKPAGFDFVNDSTGFVANDNDNDAGLNGRTESFVVPSGQSLPTIDAGLKGSAAINGIVWRDENANSVRDASDTIRLSGVGVTLTFTPTNAALPPFTVSTTTAADGSYSFLGLPPGSYKVSFATPAGFAPVGANVGSDDTIDSDGPVASGSLAAAATVSIDQGFRVPATRLFLPMVIQAQERPDLVVVSIAVDPASPQAGEPTEVSVTVRNQGTSAASNFWVDFYINPSRLPQVNDPWNEICDPTLQASNQCYGIAWFYEGTLQPGESVVLNSRPQDAANPTGYRAASSVWPGYFAPGSAQLYAIVDSWNRSSDGGIRDPNGAVIESNETNNRIEQPIVLTPGQVQTRVPNRQLPADLSSRRFNP